MQNSALTLTKASLGKTSGIEVLYAYNNYVVFVLVVGTCTVAIEAWKTIQLATLPAAACPSSSLMVKGQLNYYAQINSDGKVYLGAENAQPAKYANISFCYIRGYK